LVSACYTRLTKAWGKCTQVQRISKKKLLYGPILIENSQAMPQAAANHPAFWSRRATHASQKLGENALKYNEFQKRNCCTDLF